MKSTQKKLIYDLTYTYMQRCEHFVSIEDVPTAHALYSEYVANGVDPAKEKYEWFFMQSFPTLR